MSSIHGYITIVEMAAAKRVDARSLRSRAQRGLLPGAVKLGRDWVVPQADAERYPVGGYPKAGRPRKSKRGPA